MVQYVSAVTVIIHTSGYILTVSILFKKIREDSQWATE